MMALDAPQEGSSLVNLSSKSILAAKQTFVATKASATAITKTAALDFIPNALLGHEIILFNNKQKGFTVNEGVSAG
jgi:hypothetical protein